MIKVKNITKIYGQYKVVNNLSFNIPTGTMFGFLGPNGAGKTTAMKLIIGLNEPDKGKISIDGKNMDQINNRSIIGYMPEDPYFYEHLTAIEFMNFMSSLFINSKKPKNNQQILETVGLADTGKKRVGQFSKGMKQRLGLAQALVNDPEYLFLDEPLDGLDPIGRQEFKKILLDLKKRRKTIMFNSHILSDVEEICDQIGIIDHGKLVYSGNVKSFRKNKSLEEAFVEKLTNTNC